MIPPSNAVSSAVASSQMALFSPLRLGEMSLSHRVVLAPLTRSRSPEEEANALNVLYYHQRASPGGLLITEGTWASQTGRGYDHVPGCLYPSHAKAWQKVTEAVHLKGGYIFAQLWHVGRVSKARFQPNQALPVCPSATPAISSTHSPSRALTISEIKEIVEEYRTAATVAKEAGFDGVEIHAAHGYLVDEFFQNGANTRIDEYGGSVENRARFFFEILDAILSVLPASRVGLRLSPFGEFFGVSDSDPETMFKYVLNKLSDYNPVYIHLTEPVWGMRQEGPPHSQSRLNALLSHIPKGSAVLLTGGYCRDSAEEAIQSGRASLIGFGRPFISNPDLPERLLVNKPLFPCPKSEGLYGGGAEGYTTYKTWAEQEAEDWIYLQTKL